jgi:curved DNA-binding protein CbpA
MMAENDEDEIIDYYCILGVHDSATQSTIRKAYHKLALKWHPDKNQRGSEKQIQRAQKRFQYISDAYKLLSNETQRREYDREVGVDPAPHSRSNKAQKRASTADSPLYATAPTHPPNKKMSHAFESAVNAWDSMMDQLLEPVRRRNSKKIQKIFRGYVVRKKYWRQMTYLCRQRKKRRAMAREHRVLKKAQCRVEKESRTRASNLAKRAQTAPSNVNGIQQTHSARGKLFVRWQTNAPPPPVPRRRNAKKKQPTKQQQPQPHQPHQPQPHPQPHQPQPHPQPHPTPPDHHHQTKQDGQPNNDRMKVVIESISAAAVIQRCWRTVSFHRHARKQTLAAQHIQRIYRGKTIRNRIEKIAARAKINVRKSFVAKINANITQLQSRYRGRKIRRAFKNKQMQQWAAAIKIQLFLQQHAKKKKRNAVKKAIQIIRSVKQIQSIYRMWRARTTVLGLALQRMVAHRGQHATRIQSLVRQHGARQRFLQWKVSSEALQRHYRSYAARRNKSKWMGKTATRIQSLVRQHGARQRFLQLKTSSAALQRHYRFYVAQRNTTWIGTVAKMTFVCLDQGRHRQRRFHAQRTIVSAWRCCKARDTVANIRLVNQQKRHARVLLVQSWYRKTNLRILAKQHVAKLRTAARQNVLNQRATQLQCVYKKFMKRKQLALARIEQQQVCQCIRIQCWYRCIAALQHANSERTWRTTNTACIAIQCFWRRVCAKQIVLQQRRAKAQTLIEAADLCRRLWWERRSMAANQIQRVVRRFQRQQKAMKQGWVKNLVHAQIVLQVKDVLSSYRAKKWQVEHSVTYSSAASSFPSRSIKTKTRVGGRTAHSSPNRLRRQQQSKIILPELTSINLQSLNIQTGGKRTAKHTAKRPPGRPPPPGNMQPIFRVNMQRI